MTSMTRPFYCGAHEQEYVWEEGGREKPTVWGRWKCEGCDAALARSLDNQTAQPEYERLYIGPYSRIAHLAIKGNGGHVLCGVSWEYHFLHQWFGTGSQEEYDHAAKLPTCKKCEERTKR